jgi:hypothetical protein
MADEQLKPIASTNVEFVGQLNFIETLEWFQKTKVYRHLFCRESVGLALGYAMACECFPVVTER